MEDYLHKFRELLKYGLSELQKIEQKCIPDSLSLIDDYNFDELYDEIKCLIGNLLAFKDHNNNPKPTAHQRLHTDKTDRTHVHLTDLSNTDNNLVLNDDLKKQLKDIQQKYIQKVSRLLQVDPIKITPMPFPTFLNRSSKSHKRKASSFKSLNKRHHGTDRNYECDKKHLITVLANASSNFTATVKKKFAQTRFPIESIIN
jgi:hypothetical protein